ncbi:3-hydroxybutyryl-CoA dehydrogenase [Amycolatopsis lexingtonensis]|uniref:3-hydroxybutyryl-CoA dehydrogenase n=2 Tax=Amycolatopsis lexingtonensis TaxID=218822 RepID=A0ABR9HX38_9PSEU|nr:3-hydroxybutyryl-CoA dehydrogenase [Amycolatopsis lexingtonensis]MBE1495494.1 3-hydroxybutyryl-CoA dehydrogenase [Amycolatopsis lexingtonensis]
MERVGVVGCGQMGAGIAEVCARAGLDVVVVESSPEAVAAGRRRLEASLARAEKKGKVPSAAAVLDRIRVTESLDDLADRTFVVEAIVEDEAVKTELFGRLDKVVTAPDAILASNTSSIPIMKLGTATERPAQVVGVHFFNPVPVLPLVELVPSLLTTEATVDRARTFAQDVLGKQAILCQDRAGFVVNALLIPFILAAIRMFESGFATREAIDEGLVRGAAHPQGPLALADLIGLDTTKAVAESLYEEFKEPLYAPPPLLARMVDAGLLGRKTGRGFYTYERP